MILIGAARTPTMNRALIFFISKGFAVLGNHNVDVTACNPTSKALPSRGQPCQVVVVNHTLAKLLMQ
jgi:hypothetical protein